MGLRAFILILLFWSQAAFAEAPLWRVSEVAGRVEIVHGGRAAPAVRGASLAPGDTVAAGARARAVLVRGQEYVIVAANSRLRLPAAEQKRGIIQMIQEFGRATFRIERKETPHFGVQTPYLVALVKGTVFTVRSDGAGALVAVEEGRVEVSTPAGEARQMVNAGMTASATAAAPGELRLESGSGGQAGAPGSACASAAGGVCTPKLGYSHVDSAELTGGPPATDPRKGGGDDAADLVRLSVLLNLPQAPAPAPQPPAAPAPEPAPAASPTPAPRACSSASAGAGA